MLLSLSLLVSAFTAPLAPMSPCTPATATPIVSRDSTLRAIFDNGRPYAQFLAATKARREGWMRNTDSAQVDVSLVARARAVGGSWKLLVVAVDACNDSMNSLPFVARLVDSIPGIELRVVLPDAGKSVQESHRSLDGRLATPTFVLLDATDRDVGCIVELPRELRQQTHALRTAGLSDSAYVSKRLFYEKNQGRGITAEFVEMLEAAKTGTPHCDRGRASD